LLIDGKLRFPACRRSAKLLNIPERFTAFNATKARLRHSRGKNLPDKSLQSISSAQSSNFEMPGSSSGAGAIALSYCRIPAAH
jgi:hypothetical protein